PVRSNLLLWLWLALRPPLRLIGQDVTRLVRTGWQRISGYEIDTDSIAAATSAPSFTAMAARNGCVADDRRGGRDVQSHRPGQVAAPTVVLEENFSVCCHWSR